MKKLVALVVLAMVLFPSLGRAENYPKCTLSAWAVLSRSSDDIEKFYVARNTGNTGHAKAMIESGMVFMQKRMTAVRLKSYNPANGVSLVKAQEGSKEFWTLFESLICE